MQFTLPVVSAPCAILKHYAVKQMCYAEKHIAVGARVRKQKSKTARAVGLFSVMALLSCAVVGAQQAQTCLADKALTDLMNIPVYSASRYSQPASEAPASVTVVTRTEIQQAGYRTLADVLRNVRGLYVSYDRQYSYVGVRGFAEPGNYNTRILVMIDGHRTNDAVYEQAMVGTEFALDTDLIARVEVVLGPSSSLYGTNAVFAVVNVITRDQASFHGLEFEADAGSWNTYRGRVSYGARLAGVDAVLSGTYYSSKGHNQLYYPEYDNPLTNNGIAAHVDDDRFDSGFAKLSSHGVRLEAAYVSRDKADPTAAWGDVFNDPGSRSTDGHGYLDLRYEHALGDRTKVVARTYYDRALNDGYYPYPDPTGNRVLNRDFSRGESWGAELQASSSFRNGYRLTSGFEYRNDYRQEMSNYDVSPAQTYLHFDNPSFVAAPYLEAELPLLSKVTVTPSVREDYNPRVGWMLSPRIALNFHPEDRTTFKVIYGEAFRSPNAYEQYYYPGVATLRPERDRSWEGDLDQKFSNHFSIRGAVYKNQLRDFIGFSSGTGYVERFGNLAGQTSAGIEAQVDGHWQSGVRISAIYSNSFMQQDVDHTWLESSPKNVGKVYGTVPMFARKASVTVDGQYMGRRLSLTDQTVSPYAVANSTILLHTPAPGIDLSASLYNALNKTFYDPAEQQHLEDQIQQDGRAFRVKLIWNPGAAR
ncbi:MAG: TonB-dependent receptor [Acidobacteriota bacterium]|nr:TonB-dependent receptor [Acidobacteriota bacterium]